MSIFKGKQIRLLKAKVDCLEKQMKQVKCEHEDVMFSPWDSHYSMGYIKCRSCDKMLKEFRDESEFLKAKNEIMQGIIEKDKKRIAEIEKV